MSKLKPGVYTSTLNKKVSWVPLSWVPFILGILIASLTILFVGYRDFITHATLKNSEEQCANKKPVHVLFYGGEEPPKRLEEICKAFDRSMCPTQLHMHILIPLQAPNQVTPWDIDLLSICQSMPTYNVFFSDNVHLHKYNYKKAASVLSKSVEILQGIESIEPDSLIMWLPSLVILEKHWDTLMRTDWEETAAKLKEAKFKVFPLLKYEPSSFLEVINSVLGTRPKSRPGYFYVDPLMLSLDVRELHHSYVLKSLGLSLRYPFLTTKSNFLALSKAQEQDLALSYFVAAQFGLSSVVHASRSIGQTLITNMPSREQSKQQLLRAISQHSNEEWFNDVALEASNEDILVHGRAILGMTSNITLQEKLAKWGSEAKYESTKEGVLF